MSRAHSVISRSEVSDQLVHPARRMTEQEFIDWVGDGWAEWVNGEVIMMSPVNFDHADVHGLLFAVFRSFADEHDLGKVVSEPFQIRFASEKSRRSPDIIFVSHRRMALMKKQHFEGAPDLILEIISPDSQSRDRREKFLEYQKVGVREYWIVDPLSERVEVHTLTRSGQFKPIRERDGKILSKVLSGFYLKPEWLWRKKLPAPLALLREINTNR
jgi:Uma2 family endonuclease